MKGSLETNNLRGFAARIAVNSGRRERTFATVPDTGTLCFLYFAVSTPFYKNTCPSGCYSEERLASSLNKERLQGGNAAGRELEDLGDIS